MFPREFLLRQRRQWSSAKIERSTRTTLALVEDCGIEGFAPMIGAVPENILKLMRPRERGL